MIADAGQNKVEVKIELAEGRKQLDKIGEELKQADERDEFSSETISTYEQVRLGPRYCHNLVETDKTSTYLLPLTLTRDHSLYLLTQVVIFSHHAILANNIPPT